MRTTRFVKRNSGLVDHHEVVPGSTSGTNPAVYATPATNTAAVMCHRYTDIATELPAMVVRQARGDASSHRVTAGASAAAVNE